jgi:hypothetical protein
MDEAFTTSSKSGGMTNVVRGLVGAVLGGVAGYFLFGWLIKRGFYAPMLPGALLGLGCGVFVRQRNLPLAILCGIIALALGVFTRWMQDASIYSNDFVQFVLHLNRLSTVTQLLLALGGLCGFWFALGTRGREKPAPKE